MRKFLSYFGIAILGGVFSLLGYSIFFEKSQNFAKEDIVPIQTFKTNYNATEFDFNTATYSPTNFTEAAEKSIHAVVHVKNTAISTGINSIADLFNGSKKHLQIGTGSGVIISSDGYIVT